MLLRKREDRNRSGNLKLIYGYDTVILDCDLVAFRRANAEEKKDD